MSVGHYESWWQRIGGINTLYALTVHEFNSGLVCEFLGNLFFEEGV